MRVMIFDTETTGLIDNPLMSDKLLPHIIEFYGAEYDLDKGEEEPELIGELDFLCKPPVEIDEVVQRITGIKPEDVADAEPFSARAEEVAEMIARVDEVVAHNLSYDMKIVEVEARRLDLPVRWPEMLTCTVEATEHLRGHRLKLSALHEELFGEPFEGAHRAKADVQALARCYFELRKRGEI